MFNLIRHIFCGKMTLDKAVEQATFDTTLNIIFRSSFYQPYNVMNNHDMVDVLTKELVSQATYLYIHYAIFEVTIQPTSDAIDQAIK